MKKYIIITALLMLTACYNPNLNIATMPKPPTKGPTEYKQGWQDGCETGMVTFGNSYTRLRYKTKVDSRMMSNNAYRKGWEVAQRYCSYYIATYLSNTELSHATNDDYTKSDLRSSDTWVRETSDGFFSYDGFASFGGVQGFGSIGSGGLTW